jgi:hypothetical protein
MVNPLALLTWYNRSWIDDHPLVWENKPSFTHGIHWYPWHICYPSHPISTWLTTLPPCALRLLHSLHFCRFHVSRGSQLHKGGSLSAEACTKGLVTLKFYMKNMGNNRKSGTKVLNHQWIPLNIHVPGWTFWPLHESLGTHNDQFLRVQGSEILTWDTQNQLFATVDQRILGFPIGNCFAPHEFMPPNKVWSPVCVGQCRPSFW